MTNVRYHSVTIALLWGGHAEVSLGNCGPKPAGSAHTVRVQYKGCPIEGQVQYFATLLLRWGYAKSQWAPQACVWCTAPCATLKCFGGLLIVIGSAGVCLNGCGKRCVPPSPVAHHLPLPPGEKGWGRGLWRLQNGDVDGDGACRSVSSEDGPDGVHVEATALHRVHVWCGARCGSRWACTPVRFGR